MSTAKQIEGATSGGSKVPWEDFLGKLVVVEPLEHEHDIKTDYGITDAVRANVYVLLGPDRTEEFEDTLIFQRYIIGQIKRKIGKVVVGRVAQGEAKKNQDPPWQIAEPAGADLDKAAKFWASRSLSSAAEEDERPARPSGGRRQAKPAVEEDAGWDESGAEEAY